MGFQNLGTKIVMKVQWYRRMKYIEVLRLLQLLTIYGEIPHSASELLRNGLDDQTIPLIPLEIP